MTLQAPRAILFRVACAGLALFMSAACGRGEPSTDAERLARGRELVQQMSDRLGAATRLTVTTAETRDVVRLSGARETVTGAGEYTVQRPDHFHAKTTAGRNLESWYNGKVLTIAVHNEKVSPALTPTAGSSAVSVARLCSHSQRMLRRISPVAMSSIR